MRSTKGWELKPMGGLVMQVRVAPVVNFENKIDWRFGGFDQIPQYTIDFELDSIADLDMKSKVSCDEWRESI